LAAIDYQAGGLIGLSETNYSYSIVMFRVYQKE